MERVSAAIEDQRRMQTHLNRLMVSFDRKPPEEKTRGYVQSVLSEVDTTYQNFKASHDKIIEILRDNSIPETEVPYLAEDAFYTCYELYISLKSKLIDLQLEISTPTTPVAHASTFAMVNSRNDTITSAARLPKIGLPTFSGDYLEWIPFRDMFLSLVHNNTALTQVQKYFYLKGSCTGTPKEMVDEYPAADASYALAWSALVSRYHNKRKLIDQILKKLFNASPTDGGLLSIKTLLDLTRNCLALLKTVDVDTTGWDPLLIFILTQKLDKQTRKEWEQSLNGNNDVPQVQSFLKFLENTYRALEFVEGDDNTKIIIPHSPEYKNKVQNKNRRPLHANTTSTASSSINSLCPCCQKQHQLYKCFKFAALSATEKKHFVMQNKLCLNCLGKGHTYSECRITSRCQVCKESHHTVLHTAFALSSSNYIHGHTNSNLSCSTKAVPVSNQATTLTPTTNVHSLSSNIHAQVLLPTVRVIAVNSSHRYNLKALVDQGAQASFITEDAAQLLNLKRRNVNVSVSGIGGTQGITARKIVKLTLRSHYEKEFSIDCQVYVLPKITSYKPSAVDFRNWPKLSDIYLADPTFASTDEVDMIIGCDIYGEILLTNMRKYERGILLQETHFGWMISGPTSKKLTPNLVYSNLCTHDDTLRSFWEQEELFEERRLSPEDSACEKLFLETYARDNNGRFTVHLPFKTLLTSGTLPSFTGTDLSAIRRLKQLENRFKSNPTFAASYKEFLSDYESLGHMEKIGEYPRDMPENCYVFCHHGVLRESSTTTKLRVVFDGGNCRPLTTSLNEELASGPPLQNDLPSIITRWRCHKIAFTADLEKMFRQIMVCDAHQQYQCILWRDDVKNNISIYKLRTVTYGTTSAPYLAIRVLRQLAVEENSKYPLASKIFLNESYVDDIISGTDSIPEAIELQQQLSNLSNCGGFNLRKWNSNCKELMQSIPLENRDNVEAFQLKDENFVKALGLYWEVNEDNLCFKLNFNFASIVTKGSMLSDAAKLFDPLGWLAPVTIVAKIMFQRLWKEHLDWHDPLPTRLHEEWIRYRDSLKTLENIKIPRWLSSYKNSIIDLHGFSDSSSLAYAAVVYAVVYSDNSATSILLQSKTKVAPLKVLSIPRLELCAATLLAKLMTKVKHYLDRDLNNIYYWTDSMVVLSWIQSCSTRWTVYVANRVAEIQRCSTAGQWRHIPTSENPADCLTRGLSANELRTFSLWWNGPQWLIANENKWPVPKTRFDTDLEQRKSHLTTHVAVQESAPSLYPTFILNFSSLARLKRVTAYVMRFFHNTRATVLRCKHEEGHGIESGYLKTYELNRALNILLKAVQGVEFANEISCLENELSLPRNCKLLPLCPFIDSEQLLRVGGRINKAETTFDRKHPILLTKTNPLSLLIFTEAHHKTLHGGVQLMMSYVMRRYWILSSRSLARSVLRKCVICFKYTAKAHQQQMGNLPAVRLQPTKPFLHSGLDYAGPITLKQSTARKAITSKGYICLFVCMSTKAVHLEAVSSLTSDAFIAAFRRFVCRRGRCAELYSDNGTTFVGANKEIQICLKKQIAALPEYLAAALANEGTTWHFIPPASPHFGGLWEAGVKSTKHHLRRVMKDRILTYEELSTLLTQIERCLNSRPLYPLTTHPDDQQVLTPAHFLVGEPTTCISEENLLDTNIDRLTRWKLVERVKQHFWRRWTDEYLHTLQTRSKWIQQKRNPAVGDVVLLLHERSAPGYWPLAKIHEIHPGTDGLVRVVTLLCNGKFVKRPISKICMLPTAESDLSHKISIQDCPEEE